MSVLPLRDLQRWFAGVLEHPGSAAAALASRRVAAIARQLPANELVAGNPRLSAAAMLDVYGGGYLERLVEVLRIDFGGLHHLLGNDDFRRLAARFVAKHPSRHPNLNQLGAPFAAFVRRQRWLPHRAFAAELASVERALCVAFDAREFTPLVMATLATLPPAQQAEASFVANPSVQLLTLRFPVDAWYQSWKEGRAPSPPARERSWLLIFRREQQVWRQRLTRDAWRVLQRLLGGRPLGEALAAARPDQPVQQWFAEFARDGLFAGVLSRRPRGRARC
jgi:hypothetical protein